MSVASRRGRLRSWAIAAGLVALLGCSAEPTPGAALDALGAGDVADGAQHDGAQHDGAQHDGAQHDGDDTDAPALTLAPALPWQPQGALPLDASGQSALVQVLVPRASRFVAIRLRSAVTAATEPACLRLADVTANGVSWVGPRQSGDDQGVCGNCPQRVQSGRGYALAVLPNDGSSLADVPGDKAKDVAISMRATLRHCQTGVPLSRGALGSAIEAVDLDVATEAVLALPDGATPTLRLDLVLAAAPGALAEVDAAAPGQGATALLAAPVVAASVAQIRAELAKADVEVRVVAALPLAAVPSPLRTARADSSAIDQVQAALDAATAPWLASLGVTAAAAPRLVPIVWVPCLRRSQPLGGGWNGLAGLSERVPGGARVPPHASMVLLSTDRCEDDAGAAPPANAVARTAAIALHELGHYLGLYHSDTSLGAHRQGGESDVMTSAIATAGPWQAGFSPLQRAVLRRHPDLWSGDGGGGGGGGGAGD